ncbi:YTH domain-containing protein 1 [Cladobotryum mycophilum]|uniref:YTH domain-containing protein 1 n=1 Tax=Cladobotryum mycophilum TaxID=491253 RepID=A0ABR0S6F4_9HYPO
MNLVKEVVHTVNEEILQPSAETDNNSNSNANANADGDDNSAPLYHGVKEMAHGLSKDVLEDIVDSHEDLKLWLEYTRFYDIEYRNKILSGLRKLKALDAQRSEILSEIQNASGNLVTPLSPIERHGAVPSIAYSLQPPTLSISSGTSIDYKASNDITHNIQCLEEGGESQDSTSCVDTIGSRTHPPDQDGGGMMSAQTNDCAFPHHHDDNSILSTTSESVHSGTEAPETEITPKIPRYKVQERPRRDRWQPSLLQNPDNTQVSRYFLIKSFNTRNVEMSQKEGLWITKAENGKLLTEAFNKSKSVILFWSINKSQSFQGYARMLTAPRPDIEKTEWMTSIHWKTSHPFQVEWLNTRHTEFWKVGELKNDFNEGRRAFVGRDGQEYTEACGRRMMKVMDKGTTKRKNKSSWTTSWADDGETNGWDSFGETKAVDDSNWSSEKPWQAESFVENGDVEEHDDTNLIDY